MRNHLIPVLTIDGPSGSGKGTIAQRMAQKLGWHYLDSGAIYRVLAVAAMKHHIDLADTAQLTTLASNLDLNFKFDDQGLKVLLEGENVTDTIRTEQMGNAASKVAAQPAVRSTLLERQRDFKQAPGLVTDGRDMGTVVFEEAPYKVFLTANSTARAERRYKQLKEKGIESILADLTREVSERDERDSQRSVAPLCAAEDALVLDSTALTIEEVYTQVLALVS